MVPTITTIVQSEKRKRLQSTLYYLLVPPLVFVAAYAYLRIFTPMAPDWWHDGYMLANALAIRDGAVPYRDIFQIYGMTTTYIHGIFQPSEGHTVLSLRNLSIAISALTAAAICLLPTLDFPRWFGIASALTWVLLSDYAWSDDTWWVLPWSPVIATFLLVLIVLVAGHTERLARYLGSQRKQFRNFFAFALPATAFVTGLLVTLTIFTRVLPGLLSAIALVFFFAAARTRQPRMCLLGWFVFGLVASLGVTVSTLARWKALGDAFDQTFGFSSGYLSILFTFFRPSLFVIGLAVLVCATLIAVFGAHLVSPTFRAATKSTREFPTRHPLWFVLTASSIFVGVALSYALSRQGASSLPLLASAVVRFFFWSSFGLMLAISLYVTAKLVVSHGTRMQSSPSLMTGIIGVFALIAFSSAVPSISPRYIWWTMPIGLFLVFVWLVGHTREKPALVRPLLLIAVSGAVAVTILIATAYSARLLPRNEWAMGSGIFVGMYMPAKDKEAYENLVQFVTEGAQRKADLYFWCDSPVASISTNRFLSASKFPTYAVPGMPQGEDVWSRGLAEDIKLSKGMVLLCADNPSEAAFEEHLGKLDFREVARAGSGNFKLLDLRRKGAVN